MFESDQVLCSIFDYSICVIISKLVSDIHRPSCDPSVDTTSTSPWLHTSDARRFGGLELSEGAVQQHRYDDDFVIQNYYEYEQGSSEPIIYGRLRSCIPFWKDIGASDDIIDTIENGYKIPFVTIPSPKYIRNNKSAIDNSDFVAEAINALISKNLICELHDSIPDIVNPLTVATQSSGKKRLILDLRHINIHVWKQKIKFDDYLVALEYFKKGYYMFSFDLKSAYHHISIFPDHRQYLSFAWDFGHGIRYFSFQVLPFGLSSAPYIFTKSLRPLVKHWREQGFLTVLYLDDGWGCAPSYSDCTHVSNLVRHDLIHAGFIPNSEKSIWTPVQSLNWLGISWDSEIGCISITDRRIIDILSTIDSILSFLPRISARKLASFVGRVISLAPVLGSRCTIKIQVLQYNDMSTYTLGQGFHDPM